MGTHVICTVAKLGVSALKALVLSLSVGLVPFFGGAVADSGADGHAVALPVARFLAVVATALGAGVDPHGLAPRDHSGPGAICVAVWTLSALRTALPFLVDRVDAGRGGAVRHQAAGDSVAVARALLTLRGLEVFSQLVHISPVFAAYLLAPRTAVGRVVANMNTSCRERSALRPGARRPLSGTFTLRAMVRIQKVPFSHVIYTAVGFTGVHLSGDGECQTARDTEH